MNEILLAATLAWMSANLPPLPEPKWPPLDSGPAYYLPHSERHLAETEIWCAPPSGPVWNIEWHDCRTWPSRRVSRSGGTLVV